MGGEGRKGDRRFELFVFEVNAKDSLAVFFGREIDKKAAGKTTQAGVIQVERSIGGDHDEGGDIVHTVPFA